MLRARMAAVDRKYAVQTERREPVGLVGEEVRTEAGVHWECTREWTGQQRHGGAHIGELAEWPEDLLAGISEGLIAKTEPGRLAFLDTETTGLAGGTGTYPFLVGVGAITERGFTVRQFFMRDYGEEGSQLAALSAYLEGFDVLVTYNGRAYDQPLLETRYRLARMRPPFARMAHLDLLYGSRRLWKLQFESCRLVELEAQIVGFEREGDVPGAMIPYLYFEYLRTGAGDKLAGVFTHNAWDIVTLACLTGIVPRAFGSPMTVPLARAAEMVGLGRWLRKAERGEEAAELFRRAIAKGLPEELQWRTMWDCALLEKKQGREAGATALFSELSTVKNPHQGAALEELAKYFEHREKNIVMALEMTEAALRLERSEGLLKRRERLVKRLPGAGRLL